MEGDERAGTLATIVNQEFVHQHLAEREVVGLRIPKLVGQYEGATVEIVGVVGNVLKDGNDRQPQPELYFVHGSHGQRISGLVNLVIKTTRTTGNPATLARDVRAIVREIEREAVVDRIEPLTTTLAASLDAPRFAATVMGGFAGVAMVLAAVGLYGALSYAVSQRVRELAIRAALGARRADLVRLVLREGLSVTTLRHRARRGWGKPVRSPHAGSAVRRHCARRGRLCGGAGGAGPGVRCRVSRPRLARGVDGSGRNTARVLTQLGGWRDASASPPQINPYSSATRISSPRRLTFSFS